MDSMRHYSTYQSQFIEMFGQVSEESPCLNDIAQVYDGTHKTPTYTDSGIPFISVENISDVYGSKKYISKDDYDLYKHKPESGDIFMTRIGSIGKCAVYESHDPLAYYVSLALIKPNKDIVHPKFLKYYIESTDGALELKKRSLLKAFPMKINLGEIGKIKVIVPGKDKQLEFVKVAEQADKSKFTSLKSQFIEMFKDLPINGKIEDLVERNIASVKKSYQSGDEIEYIDISSIDNTSNTVVETTKYEVASAPSRAQQCVKNGDILVSTVRPINRNIAVVTSNLPNLVASTGFCILRPKDGYREYLLSVVKSDAYTERMCDKASGGLYPAVNNSDVLSYGIHIPNKELAQKVSSIYQQADKSKFELSKSIEAIDAVIKSLING